MQIKCIVIGAGELQPEALQPCPIDWENGAYVIAVDGGLAYCRQMNIEPDYIIGDFDSVSKEEQQAVRLLEQREPQRVKRLKPEKDDTDMIAALRHGLECGYRNFDIYAGMGGRLEHTIANLQSLIFLKEHGARGCLLDAGLSCFVLRNEEVDFKAGQQGYLSLFSMGERAEGVTIRGMKYPLEHAAVTNSFPIGIDNEFMGQPAKISVENGMLLIIVRE